MKGLAFIFLFFAIQAVGAAPITLSFNTPEVKQGELTSVHLTVEPNTAPGLELQKLKGQTLGEVLYVYDVSSLVRNENSTNYVASAKIIFTKVPETQKATYKLGTNEIEITWPNIKVLPTEAPPAFVFGEFTIPARHKWLLLFGLILVFTLLTFLIWSFYKKNKLKKIAKSKKLKLKSDLLSAKTYDEVVDVWKRKLLFLKEFPQTEEAFKALEETLFKVQFKPLQSEQERNQVLTAYESFKQTVGAGLNGI